ncbi:MAG: glycosyltransferase family 8 protein [Rickettsiales bacterium]|jgi:lipopolysaccharide biosynthesis glycosyltransferase|nr:glycosyltransferase family 8 protein [Rickettsiales bacterium]
MYGEDGSAREKETIPIFLSSDDNYSPFVASTIASVCYNTKSFIKFYVLSDGITKENQDKIKTLNSKFNNFDIEFLELDFSEIFKDMRLNLVSSSATYFRFLVPDMRLDLKKVIYLDIDLIAMGDVYELYSQDLEGKVIGAVMNRLDRPYSGLKQNSREHIYFNAGMLLIDCEKWRTQNITKKLFEIEERERENIVCQDQDCLNILFDNNYKRLDLKFNLTNLHVHWSRYRRVKLIPQIVRAKRNCIIRHYVGVKPWCTYKINSWGFGAFWIYMKMTPFYNEIKEKYIERNAFKDCGFFARIAKKIRNHF